MSRIVSVACGAASTVGSLVGAWPAGSRVLKAPWPLAIGLRVAILEVRADFAIRNGRFSNLSRSKHNKMREVEIKLQKRRYE